MRCRPVTVTAVQLAGPRSQKSCTIIIAGSRVVRLGVAGAPALPTSYGVQTLWLCKLELHSRARAAMWTWLNHVYVSQAIILCDCKPASQHALA